MKKFKGLGLLKIAAIVIVGILIAMGLIYVGAIALTHIMNPVFIHLGIKPFTTQLMLSTMIGVYIFNLLTLPSSLRKKD